MLPAETGNNIKAQHQHTGIILQNTKDKKNQQCLLQSIVEFP